MNSKHFIGIHGYMLVYSVASAQSFEMVQVIRDKILNHLVSISNTCTIFVANFARQGSEWVPICIVGNKSDLRPDQRQVTVEEGKAMAERFQCGFTEASARFNENVGKAFELLIGQVEKSQNPNEPTGGNTKCIIM